MLGHKADTPISYIPHLLNEIMHKVVPGTFDVHKCLQGEELEYYVFKTRWKSLLMLYLSSLFHQEGLLHLIRSVPFFKWKSMNCDTFIAAHNLLEEEVP